MTKLLIPLALALWAGNSLAESRSAQLLGDAPRVLLGASPRLLDPALGAAELTQGASVGIGYGEHLGKTVAVGMVASLTGVLIGAGLGSLGNALYAALIPMLLANVFIPPLLTVLVARLIGNWDSPGRFGFWLPFAGALAVNAATYLIVSLFLVVPWTNPVAMLVYTLVDGVLMGGATVGLMHLTQKKELATVTSFVPGISDTALMPLVKVNL